MGNMEEQLDRHQEIYAAKKSNFWRFATTTLLTSWSLVGLFRGTLGRMKNEYIIYHIAIYKPVIRADKRSSGTHGDIFNGPSVDKVAILIDDCEHLETHDIVLTRRYIATNIRNTSIYSFALKFSSKSEVFIKNVIYMLPHKLEDLTEQSGRI